MGREVSPTETFKENRNERSMFYIVLLWRGHSCLGQSPLCITREFINSQAKLKYRNHHAGQETNEALTLGE